MNELHYRAEIIKLICREDISLDWISHAPIDMDLLYQNSHPPTNPQTIGTICPNIYPLLRLISRLSEFYNNVYSQSLHTLPESALNPAPWKTETFAQFRSFLYEGNIVVCTRNVKLIIPKLKSVETSDQSASTE